MDSFTKLDTYYDFKTLSLYDDEEDYEIKLNVYECNIKKEISLLAKSFFTFLIIGSLFFCFFAGYTWGEFKIKSRALNCGDARFIDRPDGKEFIFNGER